MHAYIKTLNVKLINVITSNINFIISIVTFVI